MRARHVCSNAAENRPSYGEAANNYALVLMSHDGVDPAIRVLQQLLGVNPDFEMGYVTLAKIYYRAGRTSEAVAVLERLLQRNPRHAVALELLRQWKKR